MPAAVTRVELQKCILQLDEKQRAAALDLDGPVVILAKPGSGKTRCIASRVALLLHKGVPQERILCFTFTNRAADEMRRRIESYSGQCISGMWVGTFHSICARILKQYAPEDLVPPGFSICDDVQSTGLVKLAIRTCCNDYIREPVGTMKTEISRFKRSLLSLDDWCKHLESRIGKPYAHKFRSVYAEYQSELRQMNVLDFDDLTLYAVKLLEEHPAAHNIISSQFRYICVDEYQDTSDIEARLIQLLSSIHRNLCVVGDKNQAIYTWRGSNHRLITDFPRHYPNAKVHLLDTNYRSGRAIVAAAERLIKSEHSAECRPHKSDDGMVTYTRYSNDGEEADAVARCIRDTVAAGRVEYSSVAVLARMHSLLIPIRQALNRWKIPCAANADQEDGEDTPDAVQLLSIHQAKGLEFCTVFLIGLEEGFLPCYQSLYGEALAEERRLCYVAMTRAVNRLYLSSCCARNTNGNKQRLKESIFIISVA